VAFLTNIVVNQFRGKENHVIADNLSAHETKRVDAFLSEHSPLHMHFTSTHSSWRRRIASLLNLIFEAPELRCLCLESFRSDNDRPHIAILSTNRS
jgi:transposase